MKIEDFFLKDSTDEEKKEFIKERLEELEINSEDSVKEISHIYMKKYDRLYKKKCWN